MIADTSTIGVKQVLMPARAVKRGMSVREVIEECSRVNAPALPVCDDSGQVTGRVTLKNILKTSCLPEYMVELARVLGDQLSCTQDMEAKAGQVLNNPVDPYIQEPHLSITSDSPAIKALAMMEQADTSYIIVVDEGRYKGIVTILSLARTLARFDNPT